MLALRTSFALALAAFAAFALAACGGDDSVSQEELEQAKEEAVQEAEEAETEADLDKLREQVWRQRGQRALPGAIPRS